MNATKFNCFFLVISNNRNFFLLVLEQRAENRWIMNIYGYCYMIIKTVKSKKKCEKWKEIPNKTTMGDSWNFCEHWGIHNSLDIKINIKYKPISMKTQIPLIYGWQNIDFFTYLISWDSFFLRPGLLTLPSPAFSRIRFCCNIQIFIAFRQYY